MQNVIIETVAYIVATLAATAISVAGAWVLSKIGKRTELQSIAVATNAVFEAAQTTVLELQQTVVDGMKAANEDGKLTKEEIASLGYMLVNGTMEKLSDPTKTLLEAAGVDITAIIHGVGEAMIQRIKSQE